VTASNKSSTPNIVAFIPARMGSSRFPGKPMAPILGMPMIGHVLHRVTRCELLSATYVATCDREIFDYVIGAGGNAVMTSDSHERASDRCAEALHEVERTSGRRVDIAIMVQGDEPMTHPEMIREAVAPMLSDDSVEVTNLLGRIADSAEFEDRNCIKVVVDLDGNAIYFSREPIPTRTRLGDKVVKQKQICVIPFRRDFLLEYNALAPTPLEIAESVDMMRVIEHGHKVHMAPTRFNTRAVDTPEDLRLVEKLLATDPLVEGYLRR
jgi:3-deoxy-manno-octulosonate cytidylyltransferase (CMP-KDO synthetase)